MDEKDIERLEQYLIKKYDLEDALVFNEPDGGLQIELYYKQNNDYKIIQIHPINSEMEDNL